MRPLLTADAARAWGTYCSPSQTLHTALMHGHRAAIEGHSLSAALMRGGRFGACYVGPAVCAIATAAPLAAAPWGRAQALMGRPLPLDARLGGAPARGAGVVRAWLHALPPAAAWVGAAVAAVTPSGIHQLLLGRLDEASHSGAGGRQLVLLAVLGVYVGCTEVLRLSFNAPLFGCVFLCAAVAAAMGALTWLLTGPTEQPVVTGPRRAASAPPARRGCLRRGGLPRGGAKTVRFEEPEPTASKGFAARAPMRRGMPPIRWS